MRIRADPHNPRFSAAPSHLVFLICFEPAGFEFRISEVVEFGILLVRGFSEAAIRYGAPSLAQAFGMTEIIYNV